MKALILGDVHGKWGASEKTAQWAINQYDPDCIVQLGDMGFGFPGSEPWEKEFNIPSFWIDGNHDNHEMLQNRDDANFGHDPYHVLWPRQWQNFLDRWQYMPRGSVQEGCLFIGGARSLDREVRIPGRDWWEGEDISPSEGYQIIDSIRSYEGDIHTVFTHERPTYFDMEPYIRGEVIEDSNTKFLSEVFDIVQPDRWRFGHYHANARGIHKDCEWKCIDSAHNGGFDIIDLP